MEDDGDVVAVVFILFCCVWRAENLLGGGYSKLSTTLKILEHRPYQNHSHMVRDLPGPLEVMVIRGGWMDK